MQSDDDFVYYQFGYNSDGTLQTAEWFLPFINGVWTKVVLTYLDGRISNLNNIEHSTSGDVIRNDNYTFEYDDENNPLYEIANTYGLLSLFTCTGLDYISSMDGGYKVFKNNVTKVTLEGDIIFTATYQYDENNYPTHLWSETYDREMADIFKIQDEIARKVTEQLKGIILGEEIKSKEVNTEAYNLYLQAKKLYRQDTAESRKNAVTLINQSIAIDSTYAPAWQYLSVITISNAIRYNPTLFEDKLTASIAAAEKAISLDANYASAYAILAYIQSFSWDFKSASINVEKALSIEPNNSYVINISALLLNYSAEMDKAIALYFKAISIDPLGYSYYFNLSLIYFNKKKYEQAEAALQTYLLHYPNASVAQSVYSQILIGKGEIQAALEKAEKETDPFWKLFAKSIAAYASDNIADADALLAQFVKDYGSDSWPNIAEVYAYRGEKDEAFKWLELAYENKDGSLFEILNSPSFENLWGDPRWNKFINKLGLPEEHGFHLD